MHAPHSATVIDIATLKAACSDGSLRGLCLPWGWR